MLSEVFGYGVAHKVTRERLKSTGRKVYDSKSAASGALSRVIKCYQPERFPLHQNPHEFEVVALVPSYE